MCNLSQSLRCEDRSHAVQHVRASSSQDSDPPGPLGVLLEAHLCVLLPAFEAVVVIVNDSDSKKHRPQELEPSSDGVSHHPRGAASRPRSSHRQGSVPLQRPPPDCRYRLRRRCCRSRGGALLATSAAWWVATACLLLSQARAYRLPDPPLDPSRRQQSVALWFPLQGESSQGHPSLPKVSASIREEEEGSASVRILQSPVEPAPTAAPTVSPAPTISAQPSASPTMSHEPTVEPAAGPASSPVFSPSNPSPVQSPVFAPPVQTEMPTIPVAPPSTGFPTMVVYTDMPTDEPVAGTFAPTTAPPTSLSPTVEIPEIPTPAPTSGGGSTALPTPSEETDYPTATPTTEDTEAIATFAPSSMVPTPGSEIVPLSPSLVTAAPAKLTPVPVATIPWTPPPVDGPDPTPSPIHHIPWTPPPNGGGPVPTQVQVTIDPTVEPPEQPSTPVVPSTSPPAPTSGPGTDGTSAPFAPTPRPAGAPSEPSDPSPTSSTTDPPTRRPSHSASNPTPPTDPPQDQQQPHSGGVRPEAPTPTSREPTTNLAQRPTPSPSLAPTPQDQKAVTAPVTAPTAALGYSYDMVRVGREGLEMSIGLSQSTQRRRLGRVLLERWNQAVSRQRSLQQGSVPDAALCTQVWAKYMEDIIRYSVNQAIRSVELVDVEIQNVALDRLLDKAALMFFFDVQIRIRAPPAEHDVDKYISAPFDSDQEKQNFVDYLRNSDCKEFKYATSVTLIMPPSSNSVESYSSRPANTGLIVGIAAAAVAFAMLVSLFVFMKVKARRNRLYQEEEKVLAMIGEQPIHEYASEIGMRTSGDISTLSDPIPLAAAAHASRDGSTAGSFTLDYDFQKACQASVSEMSGGSHQEITSRDYFSTDDGSLEAQYVADEQVEVIAPAGVLGLILETNEDGIPVVNNVKASSVLSGQVLVGDRLLSVDGQDVTVMLASDVSKLIAFKKHKPERRLVFARSTRGRNVTRVSLLDEVDENQDQDSWLQGSTRSR